MTHLVTEQEEEFLNALMVENGIGLMDANNCAKRRRNEIKDMMDIFALKSPRDKALSSQIISLLSRKQGVDIPKENIELLLTTCKFNKVFFSFSMGLCDDIKFMEEQEPVAPKVPPFTIVPASAKVPKPNGFSVRERNAAAPVNEGFREFFNKHIAYNDTGGTLYFMGNSQKQVYLEFKFDEYHEVIPFGLEFPFTTTHDHKEHIITIPADTEPYPQDEESRTTVIRSELKNDIDYSGGIEAGYRILGK